MNVAIIATIVVTSILVFIDAKRLGIKKEKNGSLLDIGPVGWMVVCLGLWVISFPAYLYKRNQIRQQGIATGGGLLIYLAVIGWNVYSFIGVNGLPKCSDESVESVIGKILNEQLAPQKFVQLKNIEEAGFNKGSEIRVCKADAINSAGEQAIQYSIQWKNKENREFAIEVTASNNEAQVAAAKAANNAADHTDVNGEGSLEEFFVGDTLQDGNVEIQVTSTSLEKSVGDSVLKASSAEGGVYVVVNWTYKNISGKPLSAFKQPSINLVDPNGTVYSKDANATNYYAMNEKVDEKLFSDLNPDIKVKAAAVFEVSEAKFNDAWKIKIDDTLISFKKNNASQVADNDQPKSTTGWSDELKQGVLEGCIGTANNQAVHAICSCLVDQASTELTESQVNNFRTDPAVQEKLSTITANCKARVMGNAN